MDLGLAGRTAIVCGSSRGLGRACAESLAREGVALVVNGRTEATVRAAADELAAAHGVPVTGVTADIDTEAGRAALLEACPAPDILVTNNAGPPPMGFADATPDAWRAALESNLLAALFLVQAVLPGMRERRFGRIVNITSASVKSAAIIGFSSRPSRPRMRVQLHRSSSGRGVGNRKILLRGRLYSPPLCSRAISSLTAGPRMLSSPCAATI